MNKSRRDFLKSCTILGAGAPAGIALSGKFFNGCAVCTGQKPARKKNILFIAVDDLRPELGCYNHPLVQSPHIDALAKNGVLFERTYCQQAICAPTRASLLTGKRPDTTKVYDLTTHIRNANPDIVALQQHFKNNGYFSQGMGKLFHGGLEDDRSYSVPHTRPKGNKYALSENLRFERMSDKAIEKDSTPRMRGPASECADVADEAYSDGILAGMAVAALNQLAVKAQTPVQKERQPFFLGVGFQKPHLPFCAPKKYWDLYDRHSIPLPYPAKPKNAPEIAFTNWGELRSYSDIPDVGSCDEAKTRELIHGYYACVSYTDAQVGKLLLELDRLELRKDTIVVLWGDHGWKLGEYSCWSKHTNFELDTHVPLILSDPDYQKGVRITALTELVDIYPTLAELCGLTVADDLEGTSFVPLLDNPNRSWKKACFSQYPRSRNIMGYSMRTGQYRYTEWINQKTQKAQDRELYDLTNDPLCTESIVYKPENKELVARLHDMLAAGWKKVRP